MALKLYKMDDTTLPGIADAIRAKTGGTALLLPSEMAAAVGGIKNLRVETGTITPAEDTTTLTIPTEGRVINVVAQVIPSDTGKVVSAAWSAGEYSVASELGAYYRVASATSVICAAIGVTKQDGATSFNTNNESRLFEGGKVYAWTSYDWDE